MSSDRDADFTPMKRRCAYSFLVLCLLSDAIGSYIWGNTMATQLSVSVGTFDLFFDNVITSCITSQVIIGVHFLFVSFRSRNGRGWSYASLKFEFSPLPPSTSPAPAPAAFMSGPSVLDAITPHNGSTIRASAAFSAPLLESECESDLNTQNVEVTRSSVFSRLPQRLQQFQKKHLSQCRTFLIPRIAADPHAFAIARPALDLRCLRLFQALADAHPKLYFCSVFCCFTLPSFACEILLRDLDRDISVL